MIDRKIIREQPDALRKAVRDRHVKIDVDDIIRIDGERLALLKKVEDFRAMKRRASDKIAAATPAEKKRLIADMKDFDADADKAEKKLAALDIEVESLLSQLPNIPLPDVPVGAGDADNVEMRRVGEPRQLDFMPKDALALGEALDVIDVERAGKVSGSRFGYLKGAAALLEFALVQYATATLTARGFVPVIPPVLIKSEMMRAMGFLAHGGEKETYHLPEDDLYLVGTSEQSIGPMHAGETLAAETLPRRYAGFSTCFRREAGSYGKDTRGILRVHQFDKVEMFSVTAPEASDAEHAFLLKMQEELIGGLGIPYRVLALCTGDLGYPSARTYDVEAWLPSENRYREITSTSTTTDYQSRALGIKMKSPSGTALVHLLNGTAFAVGRTIVAILENFQEADGSVRVPDVLHPYMHGVTRIAPR